jgi:hypothetical protein
MGIAGHMIGEKTIGHRLPAMGKEEIITRKRTDWKLLLPLAGAFT